MEKTANPRPLRHLHRSRLGSVSTITYPRFFFSSPSLQNLRGQDLPFQSLLMAFHPRKFLNELGPGPGEDECPCKQNCDGSINPKNRSCKKICGYYNCELPPHRLPQPSPVPPVPPLQIPPDKHPGLPVFLNVFLPILATTFFFFICYAIYKFYSYWHGSRRRQSRRAQPEEDAGPNDFVEEDYGPVVDHPIWYIRTVGLQPSVISAITIVKYKRGDGLVEGTDCSVCLNEFQEDETLRLLPKCNHAFHIPCIDTWLRSHTNCPMCRAGIVTNNTTPLPAQELTVQSSGLVEEARVGVSGSGREVRREAETEASELRIGIEVQGESSGQIEPKIDESGFDGLQPMRRSVSLDSLSVSMISAAVANAFPGQPDSNSDKQLVEEKESTGRIAAKNVAIGQCTSRLAESPSIEGSMQAGSSSVKRSLSCSAKVFLSRHTGRSRNSVNPQ